MSEGLPPKAGNDRPQARGLTMEIKFECGTSSGAATAAVTQILGCFWVAILGGLLNGPTHNPNDHPEDDAITSTDGVLNTPPPKAVVGEIAVGERATVTEPDALVDMRTQ